MVGEELKLAHFDILTSFLLLLAKKDFFPFVAWKLIILVDGSQ
jgi:hypothetical protein